ncbi:MAG: ferritin family protein [Candidatus Brocadiales bacterium]
MAKILKLINDDEALRIASNLEKEGYSFYSSAAKRAKDSKSKFMFNQLAEAEKKHLSYFEELRSNLHAKKGQRPWGEEDELVNTYLRNLVDTGVFTSPKKKSAAKKKDITVAEACRIGIQTEKDSILFFNEAARLCKNRRGRKMFKAIVDEEKQHLTDLARHLRHLK